MQHPPSLLPRWLLLDKRETKPTGPRLDSVFLSFISFPGPHPHLFLLLVLPILLPSPLTYQWAFIFPFPPTFEQQNTAMSESKPQGQVPALFSFCIIIF